MNSDESNTLSLRYQSFTSSGCGDIGIRKKAFVPKTQFRFKFTDESLLHKTSIPRSIIQRRKMLFCRFLTVSRKY